MRRLASNSGRQNCESRGSTSSPIFRFHCVNLWLKRRHFTRVEQTLGIVPLLGEKLNVIRPVTSAAFDVIHVGIRDKNADLAAEINHFVEPIFADEINHRNRAGYYLSRAILHEFHMKQNLFSKP